MIARPSYFAPAPVGSSRISPAAQVLLPWADPYIARLHAEQLLAEMQSQGLSDEEASEILLADEDVPAAWLEILSAN